MIESLKIENFTAFRKVKLEFVPGINVLVGANTSGKTHALKLLFAIHKMRWEKVKGDEDTAEILNAVFRPEFLSDLIRHGAEDHKATVSTEVNGSEFELVLTEMIYHSTETEIDHPATSLIREARLPGISIVARPGRTSEVAAPVMIPVKEMLAHSVGFLSLYDQRYVDFDDTQRDILLLAFLPTLRESGRKEINPLLDKLADKIGGRVEVKGQRFYIVGEKGRFEVHLVAEGWRKLALLYELLANGSIACGTVLYWDEPEANLNPGVFPLVAEILASLAASGTQFHIATHSYALLREIEIASKREGCKLRMFSLDHTEHGVQVQQVERFAALKPNPILDEYERIFSLSIKEALRGG